MKKVLIIIGIILVVLISIFLLIFNALNKEKISITADEFQTIMINKSFEVAETTSLFAQYGNLMEKSYLAQNGYYKIEFYQLSSEENAIDMYNTNKTKFESQKANTSVESTVSKNDYNTYSLTTNGKYKYLSRVNKTLLYIDIDENYKDTVKNLVKEIGY